MNRVTRGLSFATAALAAVPSFAHPGHGRDGGSHEVSHYLTEPDHLASFGLVILLAAATAGGLAWYRRKA